MTLRHDQLEPGCACHIPTSHRPAPTTRDVIAALRTIAATDPDARSYLSVLYVQAALHESADDVAYIESYVINGIVSALAAAGREMPR